MRRRQVWVSGSSITIGVVELADARTSDSGRGCGAGGKFQPPRGGIKLAQGASVGKLHIKAPLAQRLGRRNQHVFSGACAGCEMFGRAVDGIDVIVAIVKEITDFFPRAGAQTGIIAPQSLIQ